MRFLSVYTLAILEDLMGSCETGKNQICSCLKTTQSIKIYWDKCSWGCSGTNSSFVFFSLSQCFGIVRISYTILMLHASVHLNMQRNVQDGWKSYRFSPLPRPYYSCVTTWSITSVIETFQSVPSWMQSGKEHREELCLFSWRTVSAEKSSFLQKSLQSYFLCGAFSSYYVRNNWKIPRAVVMCYPGATMKRGVGSNSLPLLLP